MDFSNISTEDLQAQLADLTAQAQSLQDSGDVDTLPGVLDQIEAIQAELDSRNEGADDDAEVEASRAELAKRFDAAMSRSALHSAKPKTQKTPVTKVRSTSSYADTYENLSARYDWTKALVNRLDGRADHGAEKEYIEHARYCNPNLVGVPVPRKTRYAGANTTDAPNAQQPYYIPEQVDMLRAGSIVDSLGCNVMDGLTQATTFTVQTADPQGNWVGEGSDSSAGTPSYTQVTVAPKTNILIVPTSRQFLLTVPNAKEQLQKQIAARSRLEYDMAFVNGAGGNAPTGVLNDASIQANTQSNYSVDGALTYDDVVAMEAACATMNGLGDNPKWLSNFKARAAAKKTVKGSNNFQFILDDDERMIGHEFMANSLVPFNLGASPFNKSPLIFFGDPSTCVAAIFGGDNFEIVVDQYTQLSSGGIRLALPFSVDFKFLQPGKIVVARDILA